MVHKTQISVFVIAFKDAKRRKAIAGRLAPLGIKPRFIDAVDGRKLTPGQREAFTHSGRAYCNPEPMRDGAIGCVLSHHAAWCKIRDEKIPAAIVLEDDATLTADATPAMFAASLALLEKHRRALDVVILSRRLTRPLIRVDGGDTDTHPGLAVQKYSDIGSESYFITHAAGAYLADASWHYRFESDLILQHWWLHGGRLTPLYLIPSLFREDGTPSRIDYGEKPRHLHAQNRLRHKLAQRYHRIDVSIRKRLTFASHVKRARAALLEILHSNSLGIK